MFIFIKYKIERGPIKLEEAVDIAIQVAKGLEKVHKKEIVHRDIKSANIFVINDGGGSPDRHLVIGCCIVCNTDWTVEFQRRI
ncbi:protein kinase [bacterium]|nr:protein kinase [bacterium]